MFLKEAERLGQAAPTDAPKAPVAAAPAKPVEKKDYTETRIQIRLPSGSPMVQSFKVNETLAAVRLYIQVNRADGVEVCGISHFFRRFFYKFVASPFSGEFRFPTDDKLSEEGIQRRGL